MYRLNLSLVLVFVSLFLPSLLWSQSQDIKVVVTPISLGEKYLDSAESMAEQGFTSAMSDSGFAPYLLFAPAGRAVLVWNSNRYDGRLALLNKDFSAVEKKLVDMKERTIQACTSTAQGPVLLVSTWTVKDNSSRTPDSLFIEGYDWSGKQLFKTRIVGTQAYEREGDQGIDTTFGTFNIQATDSGFAAYFSTMRKWDDGVVHQSEFLALFDKNGVRVSSGNDQGWNWNVSHSFRPRFAWDGKRLVFGTVGDAYPRGVIVQTFAPLATETVIPVPAAAAGETYQYVLASMGDITGRNGEAWVVFDSALSGKDYDIGLVRTSATGKIGKPIWLTNTPNVRERIPRIIGLGDQFLVMWGVDSAKEKPNWFVSTKTITTQVAIMNAQGGLSKAARTVSAAQRGATRLFKYPDGSAGWVNDVLASNTNLELVKVSVGGLEPEVVDDPAPDEVVVNATPAMSPYTIDAAVNYGNGKLYFFQGQRYIGFDIKANKADAGYPRPYSPQNWKGLDLPNIDAILDYGNGYLYFFSGKQYVKYSRQKGAAEAGYPRAITEANWPGLSFDQVDAAINWGNGKAYLFRNDQYSRLDIASGKIDPGYPRQITPANWPGLTFNQIDDVVMISNQMFFFRGDEYIRFDMATNKAMPGYPKKISAFWPGVMFP